MGMLMLETCRGKQRKNILLMNKENCALKLDDEIILWGVSFQESNVKSVIDG